jgi:hypothetical protein
MFRKNVFYVTLHPVSVAQKESGWESNEKNFSNRWAV